MQDNITKLFKAIADPTRRDIFHALVIATSALSITQISNQFEMTRQGVTKHIKTSYNFFTLLKILFSNIVSKNLKNSTKVFIYFISYFY